MQLLATGSSSLAFEAFSAGFLRSESHLDPAREGVAVILKEYLIPMDWVVLKRLEFRLTLYSP
jgi:hypothetical protein